MGINKKILWCMIFFLVTTGQIARAQLTIDCRELNLSKTPATMANCKPHSYLLQNNLKYDADICQSKAGYVVHPRGEETAWFCHPTVTKNEDEDDDTVFDISISASADPKSELTTVSGGTGGQDEYYDQYPGKPGGGSLVLDTGMDMKSAIVIPVFLAVQASQKVVDNAWAAINLYHTLTLRKTGLFQYRMGSLKNPVDELLMEEWVDFVLPEENKIFKALAWTFALYSQQAIPLYELPTDNKKKEAQQPSSNKPSADRTTGAGQAQAGTSGTKRFPSDNSGAGGSGGADKSRSITCDECGTHCKDQRDLIRHCLAVHFSWDEHNELVKRKPAASQMGGTDSDLQRVIDNFSGPGIVASPMESTDVQYFAQENRGQLLGIGPKSMNIIKQLEGHCPNEKFFIKFAQHVGNWEQFATFFRIPEHQRASIKIDLNLGFQFKTVEVFKAARPSLGKLITAAIELGFGTVARKAWTIFTEDYLGKKIELNQ